MRDGFVWLRGAVPSHVVAEIKQGAAARVPSDCSDPWYLATAAVYDLPVLVQAITPRTRGAFDSLVGEGRWHVAGIWGFPTRLPGPCRVQWHIDGDWFTHHTTSGEQVLTPIFLWEDVGPADSPTLLSPGSHHRVARFLSSAEPSGVPGSEIHAFIHERLQVGETVSATGAAGDVVVCHPFLAHTINPVGPHRPRYISNVAVHGFAPLNLDATAGALSPVEAAVAEALDA
jgi:hypothetical protein